METYRMFEIKENIKRREQIPHLTVEEIRKRINEMEKNMKVEDLIGILMAVITRMMIVIIIKI